MKKVLITGTFDVIHPGHLNLISQAQKLGDFLIVVVARDINVVKAKGREPYYNEQQRLMNLENFFKRIQKIKINRQVNFKTQITNYKIILGDEYNPYKVIDDEQPEVIALGYDQSMFVEGLKEKIKNSENNKLKIKKIKIVELGPFKEDICKSKSFRRVLEDQSAGFLLINKPTDWT